MNIARWADQNLRRFGDHEAVIAGDRTWTVAALHDESCRLASALVRLGVQPGDRAVLVVPNGAELVVAFTAALRCGAVAVPLFAGASAREIERIVGLSEPKVAVTSPDLPEPSRAALSRVSIQIITGGDPTPGGGIGMDTLIRQHEPLATPLARDANDPAVLSYTSGTSGAPKGVVHTHGSITARHGGGTRRLRERILIALPLGTLGAGMLTGRLAHQWTLVLQDTFEPHAFLDAIARQRITKLVLVPAMGEAIAAQPDLRSFDLSSLRSVGFTGADVPPALLARLATVLPVNPSVAYGMTETGGGIAATGLGSKPGSVGRILKGVDVKIVGERGEALPHGETGEIYARTPWMGAGYFGQPEETAASFTGGWIRTGDLGYIDDDNELFLVGRRKDLIIQAGVKVAPREVIDALRQSSDIDECAVVGVPHALLGEQVVACVVRREGSTISEHEVLEHCRAHIDPRKVPARVVFRDALPKTPNRKVNMGELRQHVLAQQSAVVETDTIRRLRSAASGERLGIFREVVQQQLARLLPRVEDGADPPWIDPHATFGALGLDSLRVAQLGHALGDALGRSVSPTLFFSHPTVEALGRHLLAEIAGAPAAAPAPRRVAPREPVAIVGLGCRLPRAVDTPEQFWTLLREGVDATGEITRWNVDAIYDPVRGTPARTYTRRAALLDAPEMFDAEFFGVSAREALTLDPQHRLVLEVAWEALEQAGYDPTGLSDALAGVFLGISGTPAGGTGLGATPSIAVGRLCHVLDLRGPAVAVDTACSSSLAAIHNAVQSLRLGECHVAIAGGVQVIGSARSFVGLSQMGLIAADGRCKAFDASADGFGRGEGCVLLVLKRLSDALADRDRIIAVIRGTAMRHDGRSSSLTAPNGRTQQEVIRAALADGGMPARDVDYLEAHGTGTALGDPIEMEAAMAVLSDGARPLIVGSVKTNVGHLESAAGAAGLMKAALAIEHGEIPAHLHCRSLNPLLEPLASSFTIPARTQPWPATPERRRVAGVTSMGLSGTNVHVVIEQAPTSAARDEAPAPAGAPTAEAHLLCLSARTDTALRQLAQRHAARLDTIPPPIFADYCFTANAGRAHFAHRRAILARTPAEARDKLLAFVDDAGALPGDAALHRPAITFHISDDAAVATGTARALYEREPAFRRALHRCAEVLQPLIHGPLIGALYPQAGDEPERAQPVAEAFIAPAAFAIAWSLAEVWKSWGIEPDAAAGDGVGEKVAACISGATTIESALTSIVAGERGHPNHTPPAAAHETVVAIGARTAERERMLDALVGLYTRGVTPDWRAFYAEAALHRIALPTYPFQRRRYRYRAADADSRTAPIPRRPHRVDAPQPAVQAAAPARPLEEIIAVVRQQVADILEQPGESLALEDNCLQCGLDSLGVIDVVTAVRERLGIACTPNDFLSRPTIARFAEFVATRLAGPAAPAPRAPEPAAAARSPLVALNDRGSRPPLFCMHPSGGQIAAYLRLRTLLGDAHPLYAIQSRGLDDPDAEHATIDAMAQDYATLIQGVRRDGPCRLLGWSMGGLVAMAVAAELERRGAQVAMVGLVDVTPPGTRTRSSSATDVAFAIAAISAELQPSAAAFGVRTADVRAVQTLARADLHAWCEASRRLPAGAVTRERFDAMLRLYQRHVQLAREYRPGVIDAPIVEWRATSARRPYRWSMHTRGGAVSTVVGGCHFTILRPPHVEQIAGALDLQPAPTPCATAATT
jgi:acyl-CoA synthetase (AMP-forming)/AMP-acid ligase II/3-oxoacyl-(acyl-carrier-protein) synthase/thioesterase domain-containing protein/acyl carrier protein